MNTNLKGKTVLVTGGTKGIGRAICIALAKEGCHIISFSRDIENVEKVKHDLNQLHIGATYNIYKGTAVGDSILYYNLRNEKIDVIINNIGGGGSWHGSQEVMAINYYVTAAFTDFVLPNMLQNKWGRVVTISSIYGGVQSGDNPYFDAAKSAQIAYMKGMSRKSKYIRKGITFNTISPGNVSCGYSYNKNKDTDEFKTMVMNTPMGRIGRPEDVANAVKFLCSDESSYINGANIVIDGGQSVGF